MIAKGRTAEVYTWQENQVLKLFFDWCPMEWVRREVEIGHSLSTTPLPRPKMIDTVFQDGRQGIIYERADGPSMLHLASAKPWFVLRGIFYRGYFRRYREKRPEASQGQIKTWMIPVAAARLKEGIRGEEQPIMNFIRRSLQDHHAA